MGEEGLAQVGFHAVCLVRCIAIMRGAGGCNSNTYDGPGAGTNAGLHSTAPRVRVNVRFVTGEGATILTAPLTAGVMSE
jgi:hypothetical protein